MKHRTADAMKLRGNATVRRLAYSVVWELSFSVFRELHCYCLLHSVPRVQLSLITILGNCGCQFPWYALSLTQTYTSVPRATLFFIYSSSFLHVSAVPDNHHGTVYLPKTVTLYFPLYLKWISSKLKCINVVPRRYVFSRCFPPAASVFSVMCNASCINDFHYC
jgi:fucose 4-O-acetylase-like acetyltransferase